MRFLSFEIRNFRGVRSAKIDLVPTGAGIFTLIGLNESGKTTVLEAISTFQTRGGDEKSLYQAKPSQIDPSSFVPKHEKATFTGDITVAAVIEFEAGEKEECIAWAETQGAVKIDASTVPDRFTVTRGHRFENGDKTARIDSWGIGIKAKEKGSRKATALEGGSKAWQAFAAMVTVRLP
ncbi:MAG: AAA family ATPase, partial [Sphingomonadaceae bacterium]|nr:AAA family ATPase [Sphingomonadaceae bacterium]